MVGRRGEFFFQFGSPCKKWCVWSWMAILHRTTKSTKFQVSCDDIEEEGLLSSWSEEWSSDRSSGAGDGDPRLVIMSSSRSSSPSKVSPRFLCIRYPEAIRFV